MEKINWQNLPSTATPINATNLNKMQTVVENHFNGTTSMENIRVESIQSKNLYNKYDVTNALLTAEGYYDAGDAGKDFRCSNYIPIKNFNKLTMSGLINVGAISNLIEYDANKNYIDNWNIGNRTITLNANTKYVRVAIHKNDLNTFQLEYGDSATTFSEYQGLGYVSGRNENGYYVKYDDGRMECWGTKTFLNFPVTYKRETVYISEWQTGIPFPVKFIQPPQICNIFAQGKNSEFWVMIENSPYEQHSGGYTVASDRSQTIATCVIGYHAIGYWK